MHKVTLPCALLLNLAAGTALAQAPIPAQAPMPAQAPVSAPPPVSASPSVAAPASTPVGPQGVPPGADPMTGARPGNDIGTGMSLPMGTSASNINPTNTPSAIAPNLPSPAVGEGASAQAYLIAARNALAAGRTGEAQQALEMAETRLLDRSTPLFQTNTPSANPVVSQISQALQALAAGDRPQCMSLIEAAIPNAQAAEQAAN